MTIRWNDATGRLLLTTDDGASPCALLIRAQVLKPEYPDTPSTLSSLASLLHGAGDYAGAEPLYRNALAYEEGLDEPEGSRETAIICSDLATLLWDAGDSAGAERLYLRALAIGESLYGTESSQLTLILCNLGALLMQLERFEEAEEVLRRELNINFAFAGDSDSDTITSMDNLGDVLEATGDIIAMSEIRYRQLAALERTEGPDSEEVLRVMQNLAVKLRDAGHLDEAEPLQRDATRRFIHVHGEGSVKAATAYSAMGELLRLKEDLNGAEGFYRRALAIRELELGPAADATDLVRGRLERLLAISR